MDRVLGWLEPKLRQAHHDVIYREHQIDDITTVQMLR